MCARNKKKARTDSTLLQNNKTTSIRNGITAIQTTKKLLFLRTTCVLLTAATLFYINLFIATTTKRTEKERKRFCEWKRMQFRTGTEYVAQLKAKMVKTLIVGTHVFVFIGYTHLKCIGSSFTLNEKPNNIVLLTTFFFCRWETNKTNKNPTRKTNRPTSIFRISFISIYIISSYSKSRFKFFFLLISLELKRCKIFISTILITSSTELCIAKKSGTIWKSSTKRRHFNKDRHSIILTQKPFIQWKYWLTRDVIFAMDFLRKYIATASISLFSFKVKLKRLCENEIWLWHFTSAMPLKNQVAHSNFCQQVL